MCLSFSLYQLLFCTFHVTDFCCMWMLLVLAAVMLSILFVVFKVNSGVQHVLFFVSNKVSGAHPTDSYASKVSGHLQGERILIVKKPLEHMGTHSRC